jgi:hypothetical protein
MSETKSFKIGDYLLSVDKHFHYAITTIGSVNKITKVCNDEEILEEARISQVRLVYHPDEKLQHHVGGNYFVENNFVGFKKISRKKVLAYLI